MSYKNPIMLVEDDLDDQHLIIDILRDLGIENEVLTFVNGEKALDHLTRENTSPFIILCDINMPVMGGIELRQRIMDSEPLRKKSIPFVFLTTTATPYTVGQAYEMSVQGFFEKSTGIQEFRQLLSLVYNYWQKCKHPQYS